MNGINRGGVSEHKYWRKHVIFLLVYGVLYTLRGYMPTQPGHYVPTLVWTLFVDKNVKFRFASQPPFGTGIVYVTISYRVTPILPFRPNVSGKYRCVLQVGRISTGGGGGGGTQYAKVCIGSAGNTSPFQSHGITKDHVFSMVRPTYDLIFSLVRQMTNISIYGV